MAAKQSNLLTFVIKKRKLPEDLNPQAGSAVESEMPSTSRMLTLSCSKRSKVPSDRAARLKVSKFQVVWLKEYVWLNWENEIMYCTYCINANKNNTLTKGCQEFLKDILIKHARSKDHRNAIIAKHCSKDFQESCVKAHSKEKESVLAAMHSAYYLAKKHRPIDEMTDLVNLQIYQGVSALSNLNVDKHTTYTSDTSVKEMHKAMAEVLRQEILEEIQAAGVFSIIIDESTDRSTEKTLMIYCKFVYKGEMKTRYLCVCELIPPITSQCIFTKLCEIFASNNLNPSHCVGLATDGASVMRGNISGVATKLAAIVPYVVSMHCIAHRLALAVSQACHSVPLFDKYQENVNSIYKYHYYSCNKQQELKAMQNILDVPEIKFKEVFDTKWLSFEDANTVIVRSLDPLISALNVAKDRDAKANGLLKQIATFNFIASAHVLTDVLAITGKLNRIFQKKKY